MTLEWLFTPRWAGGWTATRVAVALVALATHGPRVMHLADAYASPDMVFSRGPFNLADHVILDVPAAAAVWAVGVVGALWLAWGGRGAKIGLGLFVVASWTLLSAEALNIKAYDRLLTWVCLGMFLGPIDERGLADKERSPVGRWWLLIAYTAIYGSTGFLKLLEEPGWRDGSALAYHLVHPWFGSHRLGTWVSGHSWLTTPMGWYTLAFECAFPFLVWFRRTNPWVLLAGVGFHLGVLGLMDVGTFSLVAIAAYPVLLDPEAARSLHSRITARTGGPVR